MKNTYKPNTMKKTIEEVAREYEINKGSGEAYHGFIAGAKHQMEQMYSEEEVIKLLDDYRLQLAYGERVFKTVNEWFNLNKKS